MVWAYFLAASVGAQAIANVMNRVVMRDATNKNTWAYSALSQIITGSAIGIYALATGFEMPPLLTLWPWFALVVGLNVASNIFQNEALRTAEASLYTIVGSSRVLVSMIAAVLLLNEHATFWQAIGAVIMISAIAVALSNGLKFRFEKWMVPALLYALTSGIVFIGDARIMSETSSAASYMAFAFLVPGLVTFAIRPGMLPDVVRIARSRDMIGMTLFSAAYGFMAITLWTAYQYGATASQMAPIRQSAIILTVIIAALFLRERTHLLRKLIAAVLAVIAVYLIATK